MSVKYSNNASTTLSAPITAGQTSFGVVSAAAFPSLGTTDWFYATINQGSLMEIVKVTAVSGNTLTCVRGQDSTVARAFPAGSLIELRVTRAMLADATYVPVTKSITVESPGAAEDIAILYTSDNIRITKVVTSVHGTDAAVAWSLVFSTERLGGINPVTSGTETGSSTQTSFVDATIPAGSYIRLKTSDTTGSPMEFHMTIQFQTD